MAIQIPGGKFISNSVLESDVPEVRHCYDCCRNENIHSTSHQIILFVSPDWQWKKTNNSCQKLASKPQCFRRWFFNAGSQARMPGLKINQESTIIKCGNFTGAKSCWFFYLPSNLSTFLPTPDPPPSPHRLSEYLMTGALSTKWARLLFTWISVAYPGGCIAQRKHSCFPPGSPGFKSGSDVIFSLNC